MIKRGDIVIGEFQGEMKRRPWLVIQNDKGNYFSDYTIVVPITSKYKKSLPTHIPLVWGFINGTVKCETIQTVSKSNLEVIEHLPDKIMEHIDNALAVAIGLKRNDEI